MDKVRAADPSSREGKPEVEVRAAVELISMNDAGEAKGLITEDQIGVLKDEYSDTTHMTYIHAEAVGGRVNCKSGPELWVLIWNSSRSEPPVERQFDWYERYYKCKQKDPDDIKAKEEDLGIAKSIRSTLRREYEAARKDKEKRKSYVDRMVAPGLSRHDRSEHAGTRLANDAHLAQERKRLQPTAALLACVLVMSARAYLSAWHIFIFVIA